MLNIQVIYATLESQEPIDLRVSENATLSQALEAAQLSDRYPELRGQELVVGIFGEVIHDPSTYPLEEGDRIEIYRPLKRDPKDARRQRAS